MSIKGILSALTLISRIPLGFITAEGEGSKTSVIHFPFVGYVAFCFWYLFISLFHFVFKDTFLSVAFALACVYYFFNLFHFDGFLDSIDGLFSQKPRDEVFRIMSSGNIGPFALFAGVIYLAVKLYLAVKIAPILFLPVFVLSRWGMSFSAAMSKPAKENGMCTQMAFGNMKFLLLSTLYLPLLFILSNWTVIAISLVLVTVFNFIIIKLIERKINGLTGDNFGLINEIDELLVMLVIFTTRVIG